MSRAVPLRRPSSAPPSPCRRLASPSVTAGAQKKTDFYSVLVEDSKFDFVSTLTSLHFARANRRLSRRVGGRRQANFPAYLAADRMRHCMCSRSPQASTLPGQRARPSPRARPEGRSPWSHPGAFLCGTTLACMQMCQQTEGRDLAGWKKNDLMLRAPSAAANSSPRT